MAGINITQIATELGAYFRNNNKELRQAVYQEAQLFKYTKTITKVKGRFPAPHSVSTNVVQGFTTTWNELGETKFKANELINYHQKVNFPIIPADILNTWLAELYEENKKPDQMPISQYIAQKELMPKVTEDVEYLLGHGVYNAGALGTFGNSMNGLIQILTEGVASSTNPMYKIPLATLTDSNIVSQVEKFEKNIPTKVKKFIKNIYMSTTNKERYIIDMRTQFGANTGFSRDQAVFTYLGSREIIGLDCLNGSDFIFTTPEGNMLKLIDINEPPVVSDIQVADYKVKIFMEWWLGIAFWMNQMVLVSVNSGSGSGLATDNDSYFMSGL